VGDGPTGLLERRIDGSIPDPAANGDGFMGGIELGRINGQQVDHQSLG
jgi:hypothetical protein